jgi:hypothetical protein
VNNSVHFLETMKTPKSCFLYFQNGFLTSIPSSIHYNGSFQESRWVAAFLCWTYLEFQVDLLGDEVETLLRLLERIYVALDHYSPILQHYPGVRIFPFLHFFLMFIHNLGVYSGNSCDIIIECIFIIFAVILYSL